MAPTSELSVAPYAPPPPLDAVEAFVARWDARYGGKLSNFFDYTRVISLCDFERTVSPRIPPSGTIAVVSGGLDEPELALLPANCTVEHLCYPDDPRFDLSLDWDASYGQFDLVLCNQVLEHVPDPLKAMRNLRAITAPGGRVFVSIPVINCVHGLPHFYSAGYYPTWLRFAFEMAGLSVEHISYWGSRKHLLNAVAGRWLGCNQLKKYRRSRRELSLRMMFEDGRIHSNDPRILSGTWGLARRP